MALKINYSTRNGEYRLEVETDDLYSFQMLRTLAWFCRDREYVIRCKNCEHRLEPTGMCMNPMAVGWDALEPNDDDFCSRGKRRYSDD
jgi:hypothetical protein